MFAYKLSREEMAEKIGATTQSIGRWVNDARVPPKTTRIAIASILGIAEDIFLERDLTLEIIFRSGLIEKPGYMLSDVAMVSDKEITYGTRRLETSVITYLQELQVKLDEIKKETVEMIGSIEGKNF